MRIITVTQYTASINDEYKNIKVVLHSVSNENREEEVMYNYKHCIQIRQT